MADETIHDQPLVASAAANDEIGLWVVGSGAMRRITKANFIGATLTGAGTIATGGFTLTIPATGTAALLGTAQTFTAAQTFAPAGIAAAPLKIDSPAGATAPPLEIFLNGVRKLGFLTDPASSTYAAIVGMVVDPFDNGTGVGPRLQVGHNNNGSTPAAGHLALYNLGGSLYRIWPDATGLLRIGTGLPNNAGDTSGTVVGAQTSSRDAKHILGEGVDIADVLAAVRAGAEAVRRFAYRSGAFGGEEFEGVITDYAPRYGMDRDAEHPAGRSLNVVTVIGDLLRAVANLTERIERLEAARG